VLVRFRVVVTKQVQDPVHRQQLKLILRAVPGLGGLFGGDLRAEHDIAEQARVGGFVARGTGLRRPQLVHRERQHVGRTRLPHPPLVQFGHRGLVDQQHGQLGERVDTHPVQREPGHRGEPRLVHVNA
jgi:hypothetical protein